MSVLIAVCVVLAITAFVLWRRQVALRRDAYVRSFTFPQGLFEKLRQKHPQLTLKDCQLVAHGLRQFFLAHLRSKRGYVSMPSQVADDLWHEFILYTRSYQAFCQKAFGRFFHHTPAAVLGSAAKSNAGLRRCWWHACKEENINPAAPTRLPLLFALDAKLHIANGFHYVADCSEIRRQGADGGQGGVVHCGGDFAGSGDGGSAGDFGNAGSGDASGSGCSGGDGCGGGGCGGGGGD
jgi:hypothetical protein